MQRGLRMSRRRQESVSSRTRVRQTVTLCRKLLGTGAALLDYDNDGRLDLYLLQGAGPKSLSVNRLYH